MTSNEADLEFRGDLNRRRDFLARTGGGFGALALAHLMGADSLLADLADGQPPRPRPELNGGLHHRASANRVVQLFMSGAASQCDTFDYKPALIERNGQRFDPGGKVELFQSEPGAVMASPWKWRQHGQCGQWVSDLLPHLATCVDDIAFLPAMVAKSNVHGPATFMQSTGFVLPGFPSMGAWVSYGLGSLSQNLPSFVVLPDSRGFAPNGPANWSAGFLPAAHQGTMVRPGARTRSSTCSRPTMLASRPRRRATGSHLLNRLNRAHEAQRSGDSRLEARIASYELAARLQLSAPEVLDLSRESSGDAVALRPGRPDHRGFRPQLPDRPAAARARRSLRPGLERRRQRLPSPQLGLTRRHRPRPRRHGARAWTSPPPP